MPFRATVVLLTSLVTVMFYACRESNPSGPQRSLEPDEAATYQVSYNGNGNTSGSAPSSQTKTQGIILTLAVNTGNLVKTGYLFGGWNTAADGSGMNYVASGIYKADSNITMYVKWLSNEIIPGPKVTDTDGNVYTSIIIGNQIWTVENLKTTKYNDGTAIPNITDDKQWRELTTDAYCYNDDNAEKKAKYGALYNWYAVNTGKLAPKGWRVPTDADWTELENYLLKNGHNWDGTTTGGNKIAKSMAARSDWTSNTVSTAEGAIGNNLSTNNTSKFSALPSGKRTGGGLFDNYNNYCHWWSATESGATTALNRTLYFTNEFLSRNDNVKRCGYSVRLLRN